MIQYKGKQGDEMNCSICGKEVNKLCKSMCHRCYMQEYNKKHRDKLLAQKREWRKNNKKRQKENDKRWYEQNKQRHKQSSFKAKLKKEYGITPQDYNALNKSQKGCCAICGCTKADNSGGKRLAVDHNHETGKIRGLLCDRCNRGLGYFKDNVDFLKKAITYLLSH